ncbi:hypothetical protein Dimus_024690 [Dionaea muscipula]
MCRPGGPTRQVPKLLEAVSWHLSNRPHCGPNADQAVVQVCRLGYRASLQTRLPRKPVDQAADQAPDLGL